MTTALVVARIWLIRVTFAVARLMPLRRRVVLAASNRARIDGNLAAIRRELDRRNPPIANVTSAYRPPHGLRGLVGTALNDVRTTWNLATARVFVLDDYCLPVYVVRPRRGTLVIRTGHAIAPSKRWGYGIPERAANTDDPLLRRVRVHSNYDVCVLGSRNGIASYAEATRTPPDRFVTDIGIPRTDVLLDEARRPQVVAAVHAAYPELADRRVLFYAPTYRRVGRKATHPDFLDLELMARELGDSYVLAIRRHPGTEAGFKVPAAAAGFVVDVSAHPEVNDWLLMTDVLITDYSTVVYDFALLGRPMCFFTPDYDAFAARQGFYVDFTREGLGPTFRTTAELATWLRAGAFDTARIAEFARHWLEVADGHASERFVDRLVLPALAG